MLFIQTPSDFDHTPGCYVTDYVLGGVILLVAGAAFAKLVMRARADGIRKNEYLFDIITAVGCCFAFVYSLLGGVVH